MNLANWLFGAPQFWLGVVTCASFCFAVSALALRSPKRVVEVYRLHDRAPLPSCDPFYRIRTDARIRDFLGGTHSAVAITPFQTARHPISAGDEVSEARIREARKRAMWHPHPDDELPAWKLAW